MKTNADRTAPDTDMKMWKDNAQFFNKGTSGQWQGVLSGESLALLDQVKARYPADYIDWLFDGSAGGAA
jgi:aryl sulfotransferase